MVKPGDLVVLESSSELGLAIKVLQEKNLIQVLWSDVGISWEKSNRINVVLNSDLKKTKSL